MIINMLRALLLLLLLVVPQFASAGLWGACKRFLGAEVANSYTSALEDEAYEIWGELRRFWSQELKVRGVNLSQSNLIFYDGEIETPCLVGNSEVGPFYCINDKNVYISREFLKTAPEKYGVRNDLYVKYILSHEFGHHVLNDLGINKNMDQFLQDKGGKDRSEETLLEILNELTTDGLAGYFFSHMVAINWVTLEERSDLLRYAWKMGDDVIAKGNNDRFDFHTSTHGTGEERQQWLKIGLSARSLEDINAFANHQVVLFRFSLGQRSKVANLLKYPIK